MGFLDYFSLAILLLGLLLAAYVFIFIHDIPYMLAKRNNHPHTEAIHVACLVSLFTLHAIWPIVFIWAVMKQRPLQVAIADGDGSLDRYAALEKRLKALEAKSGNDAKSGAKTND
jgi:hypothetical protein